MSTSTISSVSLVFQPVLSIPIKTLLTVSVDISTKKPQLTPATIGYISAFHTIYYYLKSMKPEALSFSTLKIFEWAVKKPLRNTPHPTATNPVQTNQVVQKSFAHDDRGGLHADTMGEPSFHVLRWLTSNF